MAFALCGNFAILTNTLAPLSLLDSFFPGFFLLTKYLFGGATNFFLGMNEIWYAIFLQELICPNWTKTISLHKNMKDMFHISILQTKAIIFMILFHCQYVLCFAQICASNWVKFILDFWSPIITIVYFSMAYFHFCHNWKANVLVLENIVASSNFHPKPVRRSMFSPKLVPFTFTLYLSGISIVIHCYQHLEYPLLSVIGRSWPESWSVGSWINLGSLSRLASPAFLWPQIFWIIFFLYFWMFSFFGIFFWINLGSLSRLASPAFLWPQICWIFFG